MAKRGGKKKGNNLNKGIKTVKKAAKAVVHPSSLLVCAVVVACGCILLFVVLSAVVLGAAGFVLGLEGGSGSARAGGSGVYIGGNLPILDDGERLYFPIQTGGITSTYGMRVHPTTGIKGMHYGTDFGILGESEVYVYPARPGEVVQVLKYSAGKLPKSVGEKDPFSGNYPYGQYVIVKHSVKGGVIYTGYMHLYRVLVRVGDKVDMGDELGIVGNTGRSTGPHLHFEVRYKEDGGNINPEGMLYCGGTKVRKGADLSGCFGFRE